MPGPIHNSRLFVLLDNPSGYQQEADMIQWVWQEKCQHHQKKEDHVFLTERMKQGRWDLVQVKSCCWMGNMWNCSLSLNCEETGSISHCFRRSQKKSSFFLYCDSGMGFRPFWFSYVDSGLHLWDLPVSQRVLKTTCLITYYADT